MTSPDPVALMALSAGLLGSGHCLGMCGGLVSALSLSAARQQRPLLFQLLYHAGRLTTYGLAGVAAGWLGSVLAYANLVHGLMRLALLGSDLLVIVLGLGSAGLIRGLSLAHLEGSGPSCLVQRLSQHLHRLPATLTALPLGLLMGLLPCGLSYAMAITAAQSAKPLQGGLIMVCFGLGTLPALLLLGRAALWLGQNDRQVMLRLAGLLVALIGSLHLWRHLDLLGWSLDGPLAFFCH